MADFQSKPEVLSQTEVDSLLTTVVEESTKVSGKTIQAFTFNTSASLTSGKLRRVRIKHEEFAGNLTAEISQLLRGEFSVRLANLETISHLALIDALLGPTSLTLFRMDPLKGLALLEISPRLGLTVVARMLGGRGQPVKEERNFTDLELTVVDEFAEAVLKAYAVTWQKRDELMKIVLLGHETSARYLKLSSDDNASIFFLTMEASYGDSIGFIRLAFLHTTLEPLVRKLTEDIPMASTSSATAAALVNPHIQQSVRDVSIPIRARWNGLQITAGELCDLRKDDVLMLDPSISSRTAIYLGHLHKFFGQVGRKGNQLAVRIDSKI